MLTPGRWLPVSLAGPEHVEPLLEDLGPKARAAMESGDEWTLEPSDADGADWWAVPCDDAGCPSSWHKDAYVSGYSIHSGTLYHDIHSVDEEGEWDLPYEYKVADPKYPANWERDYGLKAWCANQVEYARWVMENGEDPLDFYYRCDARPRLTGEIEVRCPGAERTIRRYEESGGKDC